MATVTFTTRANLVGGQPENIADVTDCLDKLLAGVNTIDTAQIAASAITDAKLASPNNALWQTYRSTNWYLGGSTVAGVYQFNHDGTAQVNGGNNPTPGGLITIPSLTDFTIAGKTAQARLLVHYLCNSTAPGVALGFGLYPVSGVAGGSSLLNITLGSQIAASATSVPSAIGAQQVAGSAFTLPSGTTYMLGVQWATTTLAAASVCSGMVDLQVRFT